MASINCQKCNSLLEEGYVTDSTLTQSKSETWIEGKTSKSIWACLDTSDKRSFEVVVYRCTNCGYLESYATVEK
ncbi:MAG: hypothetical protein LH614_06075 [Pyrinomonadaceae bacterium]|nr:hypothetical protein [Pyrinomonadaceae bacterium]